MTITRHAQLVYEFHTLKALFLESSEQQDLDQAKHLMERMKDVSEELDNLRESQ